DGVLTVGDYDGVLLQLHLASGHQIADVDAHEGRKIWSVAHSTHTPHLTASAADDRCARLWAGRGLTQRVAVLRPNPGASVCCVDLSPSHAHLLAAACSDGAAYVYDMRQLAGGPMMELRGHTRPASYCRFLGGGQLVTAATDATVALWELGGAAAGNGALGAIGDGGAAAAGGAPQRVFRGHSNEKNFVGLSVRAADGLVACGSECGSAFAYHTSWAAPLAAIDLSGAPAACGARGGDASDAARTARPWAAAGAAAAAGGAAPVRSGGGGGFVSAVCWQPAEAGAVLGLPPLLAAGTSLGGVSLCALAAR
ncbi:Protein SPA1-RELATED 2, partial [Tetrabaena socialis]